MGVFDGFRVQRLIQGLQAPDPRARLEAANRLEALGDLRAVEPLLAALEDPMNAGIIQTRVIAVLGQLGDPRASETLIRVLWGELETTPFSDIARIRAAESLGRIGDERAIRPLLRYLAIHGCGKADEDDEIPARVREALVRIGRAHPEALSRTMNEEDDHYRAETARALREVLDPSTAPVLIDALEDRNYVVRICAAQTLGFIGGEDAIAPLNRALKDVNRDVRLAARTSLDRIRDRTHPPGNRRSY